MAKIVIRNLTKTYSGGAVVALKDINFEVDSNEKKGTVRGLPIREDIQIPVQEQMIVELFSK